MNELDHDWPEGQKPFNTEYQNDAVQLELPLNYERHPTDPIDCVGGHWGFWDETWASFHGPYETETAARQGLNDYAYWLDTGIVKCSKSMNIMD